MLFRSGSVYVPNSFTPNDDNLNEIFKATGKNLGTFQMLIFNRWGAKVFESHLIDVGWDGKYLGIPAPSGIYVWQIIAKDPNGKSFFATPIAVGTVALIR